MMFASLPRMMPPRSRTGSKTRALRFRVQLQEQQSLEVPKEIEDSYRGRKDGTSGAIIQAPERKAKPRRERRAWSLPPPGQALARFTARAPSLRVSPRARR